MDLNMPCPALPDIGAEERCDNHGNITFTSCSTTQVNAELSELFSEVRVKTSRNC
jgi:hypothetical protein